MIIAPPPILTAIPDFYPVIPDFHPVIPAKAGIHRACPPENVNCGRRWDAEPKRALTTNR